MKVRLTALALGLGILSSAAAAETLTFRVQNDYRYTVHLQFFSQSRNHVWPDSGRVWVLDDGSVHTYRLGCNSGEKICYGAAVSGNYDTFWGVSLDNNESCSDCCYTCNGGTTPIRGLH